MKPTHKGCRTVLPAVPTSNLRHQNVIYSLLSATHIMSNISVHLNLIQSFYYLLINKKECGLLLQLTHATTFHELMYRLKQPSILSQFAMTCVIFCACTCPSQTCLADLRKGTHSVFLLDSLPFQGFVHFVLHSKALGS